MTASDQELLPTSLAERLTAEQRQALAEAPREKRLETLAAALAYLFIKQGDASGLVTFDRKPLEFLRAASRPRPATPAERSLGPEDLGCQSRLSYHF
mgnify:CR=1 FL=1